jgi:hypothetical protein
MFKLEKNSKVEKIRFLKKFRKNQTCKTGN